MDVVAAVGAHGPAERTRHYGAAPHTHPALRLLAGSYRSPARLLVRMSRWAAIIGMASWSALPAWGCRDRCQLSAGAPGDGCAVDTMSGDYFVVETADLREPCDRREQAS